MTKTILFILISILSLGINAAAINNFDAQKGQKIVVGQKYYRGQKYKIFQDGFGREVIFRGWNISNRAKNPKNRHLNFENPKRANIFLKDLKAKTGTNIIRWIFQWQAVEPEFRKYNDDYMGEQVAQIKKAIKNKMYILVDFHQDTFSRFIKGGANGAPKFIVDGMGTKHVKEGCWLIRRGPLKKKCTVWSMSYFFDRGVKDANTRFWNNIKLKSGEGKNTPVWDVYTDMVSYTLNYIKRNLTEEEFSYILGVDPMNEPADGTNKEKNTHHFVNQKLFKLYYKIRERMNRIGWDKKLVFSEPVVFWNVAIRLGGLINLKVRPLGYGHLDRSPGKGFVWNAHFYDEKRQGAIRNKIVKNGAYLANFDSIRKAAKFYDIPPFVSEFGIPKMNNPKISDVNRRVKASYQALDFGKPSGIKVRKGLGRKRRLFSDTFGNKIKSRYVDFFSQTLSATKWDWNPDRGNAHNLESKETSTPTGFAGVSAKAIGKFATLKDYKESSYLAFERSYIRRTSGDLISSYYNDTVKDSFKGTEMNWVSFRPNPKGKEYFTKNKFFYAVWRKKKISAPTEIFIPRHFNLNKIYIVTSNQIIKGDSLSDKNSDKGAYILSDISNNNDTGKRLFIFNSKSNEKYEFTLLVQERDGQKLNKKLFSKIQNQLRKRVSLEKSPLYLKGDILVEKPKAFEAKRR